MTTWRQEILGVAGQEMTHLALVTNLTTAVGGSAHLFRSGFPVKAGYFPSDFVIELARGFNDPVHNIQPRLVSA
ncbi:MAG: ferritin-like domain-containing protein [Nitrospirota bacterium]